MKWSNRVQRNYDNWVTRTPYDDYPDIEIFSTEKGHKTYYSHDEKACEKYDDEYLLLLTNFDYDFEDIFDELENLVDELGLQTSEPYAIEYFIELERENKEEF